MPSSSTTLSAICLSLLAVQPAVAHMEMSWPYALHSRFNPANSYDKIDYSNTSPLLADGSNFPCKGYQNDRPFVPVTSYTAGGAYNMTLSGSATHQGGSCQLSLSYDNGATFRVIKSMIGGCPLTPTYDFTIPSYAPAGNALFAWSWQNKVGNREFYMNCAQVEIASSPTRNRRRQAFNSFESLPFLWKANIPNVNSCTTIEGEEPVYPNPGPEVQYGDGLSDSSTPTPGTCDAPTPFGATYKNLNDTPTPDLVESPAPSVTGTASSTTDIASSTTAEPSTSTSAGSGTTTSTTSTTATTTTGDSESTTTTISGSETTTTASSIDSLDPLIPSSTTTATDTETSTTSVESTTTATSADSTTTTATETETSSTISSTTTTFGTNFTMTTSTMTTTTAPPLTTAVRPPILNTTIPGGMNFTTTTTRGGMNLTTTTSTITIDCTSTQTTTTFSSIPTTSSTTSTTSASSGSATATPTSTDTPPFATADPNSRTTGYLPCLPGTFLCTSATTWLTCDTNGNSVSGFSSSDLVWKSPRSVAPGTECLPSYSPYTSLDNGYTQQSNSPDGEYRDDRYVRASPLGRCQNNGSIRCANGGSAFEVCDNGGWVAMGATAAGTRCVDGEIVAA